MFITRFAVIFATALTLALPARAMILMRAPVPPSDSWYALVLELVRHTATTLPPWRRAPSAISASPWGIARRDDPALTSLAGQLNALIPTGRPPR